MSLNTNLPTGKSAPSYSRMSPTVPLFPRHFYPMGYTEDRYMHPELGGPVRDLESAPPSAKAVLVVLGVYLLLVLSIAVIASMLSGITSILESIEPAAPETRLVLASRELIPHPPYVDPKCSPTPEGALASWKGVGCTPGISAHAPCLFLPTSPNAVGVEVRIPKFCQGLIPSEPPQSAPSGNCSMILLRTGQHQRTTCQWLGLVRV